MSIQIPLMISSTCLSFALPQVFKDLISSLALLIILNSGFPRSLLAHCHQKAQNVFSGWAGMLDGGQSAQPIHKACTR